ncbi:hypothetical protein [Tunturibacter empetritectus]|uniref:Membrane protein YagU involved in acid resistance n=1 Tax=Tunturiibacter lichenicola TaxID=2051959 RepID=A0A7W8J7T4_9BACT|nr:hypothetical protein [Edaphobacter lichenicola]MBB5342882.1 putative membrane protein YagU involved in acid resistance [Edaphobacter lichenicola]
MTSLEVISLAGLLSGVLDLTATSTLVRRTQGIPLERLLQRIASGALGPSAFEGGKKTATAGLFFHFLISFTAAFVYYASSRKLAILIDHPLLSGVLYGAAVHLVMNRIVLPLSAATIPFSAKAFLTQLVIHILFVGLPIALVVSHLSR